MYLIWSRKNVLWAVVLAAVGLAAGLFLKFSPDLNTFGGKMPLTVIVDAGHGMPDGGAVGVNGTVEQEINLAIAKKLQEVLEGRGMNVVMTRSDENGLSDNIKSIREMKREDMNKRLEIMKSSGADLFISIHMNFFTGPSVNGLRVFYAANHEEIKPLAEQIQDKMSEVTGAKTTAVKTADQSLFLMKNPPLPSILAECGFLSNAEEEKKLNDEDYQSRLAWAIADAVCEYYGEGEPEV